MRIGTEVAQDVDLRSLDATIPPPIASAVDEPSPDLTSPAHVFTASLRHITGCPGEGRSPPSPCVRIVMPFIPKAPPTSGTTTRSLAGSIGISWESRACTPSAADG